MTAETKEFISKSRLDALTYGVFAFGDDAASRQFGSARKTSILTSAAELEFRSFLDLGGTFRRLLVNHS
jgi:hypothetical protein